MAAEPENETGGVDLKAADKALKEARKKLKKYRTWGKLSKKSSEVKETKAVGVPLENGEDPFLNNLARCGYQNMILHHTSSDCTQSGSYLPAFQQQKSLDLKVFNVCVRNEVGMLLDVTNENCKEGASNHETLHSLRQIAMDKKLRDSTRKIYYDGCEWKVVKKMERRTEGGGILIAITRKAPSLVKEGFFKEYEGATPYWQQYDGAVKTETFFYDPQSCHNVEVGGEYQVCSDKALYDVVCTESKSPYTTQEEWDAQAAAIMGWKCTVTDLPDQYNAVIKVVHEDGKEVTATIAITALVKEDAGDTALFMGELGQFILKAELDLYDTKGRVCRGKNVQPLASEWIAICEFFGQSEEAGFSEFLDYDEEENAALWAMWKDPIKNQLQAWLNDEKEFGDLGFGAD